MRATEVGSGERQEIQSYDSLQVASHGAAKQVRSHDGPGTEAPSAAAPRGEGQGVRAGDWAMTPGLSAAMGLDSSSQSSAAAPARPVQRKAVATPQWATMVASLDETSSSENVTVRIAMTPGGAGGAERAGADGGGPASGQQAGGQQGQQAGGQQGQQTSERAEDQLDEPIIDSLDTIAATIGYSGSITQGGITLGGSEFGRTDSAPALKNINITQGSGAFTVTATYELTTKWDTRKGTGPGGQKDIPDENAAVLTKTNYPTAVSDLTPNMSDEGGRPPRTQFWAQDLTERHEKVHAADHQRTAKEGLKQALTWLTGQTASTKTEVETLLTTLRSKIVQYIIANGAGSVGELHAYGDGAPSYKARAEAIKKKGDGGGYP